MKGIIFDLDGVICFTDEYHYFAWKQIADEENIPFDRSDNERLRGVSRKESLEIILEKSEKTYSEEEKEVLMERKNNIYKEQLQKMSEKDLSMEVKETLEALKKKGLLLAIGSSSKNTKFILKQIGLENFFHAISDGTNITKSKPHPEVFLKAADMLELSPKECLVVEDAHAGIDAAVAGGFKSAGIGSAKDYEKTTYPLEAFSDLRLVVEKNF